MGFGVLYNLGINRPATGFMVNSLSEQSTAWSTGEDWEASIRVVFRMLSGKQQVLEIGSRIKEGYTAQIDGVQCILDEKLVEKIQRAFGKGIPQ